MEIHCSINNTLRIGVTHANVGVENTNSCRKFEETAFETMPMMRRRLSYLGRQIVEPGDNLIHNDNSGELYYKDWAAVSIIV